MIVLLACAAESASKSCPTAWYADYDDDGFGTPGEVAGPCEGTDWLVDNADDCDDEDGAVHPGADESCNEVDDDCDGSVDEEPVDIATRCPDADDDGHGDASTTESGCVADLPSEWISVCDDCDDTDDQVSPARWEECDDADVDEDCDGIADDADAYGADDWYVDADGDGYGAPDGAISSCDPIEGRVVNGDDCDDADALVFPFAPESCEDTIDSDCDGGDDLCGQMLRDLDDADARYASARGETDFFGESAFATGDLTGDGHPDVGVTAPGRESQPVGVYLFDGTLDGDFDSDAAAAFVAGNAISALGGVDFDGDGLDDLATGGSLDGGGVAVHLGPLASDWEPWTSVTGGSLGLVLASSGDLDGDGRADLLVGAQRTASVARVLSGLAAGTAAADDFPSLVDDYDQAFADAILAMDSDGDGLDELLVRAGGVLYGVDPPLTGDLALATAARVVEAAGETGVPGNGLADVGDWDGDGDDDLAVTTQGRTHVLCASDKPDAGTLADHAEFTLVNDTRHSNDDSTNVSGGDFDGDGRADLAVTAEPLNVTLGAVVLPGPRFGSLDWTETNTIIVGFDSSPGGKTLAKLGDTELDGTDDLVISSPSETAWNGNSGAAWLFRGGDWVRP